MRKTAYTLVLIGVLGSVLGLAACGKAAYRDGVYTGTSNPDDTGAYGEVSLTVADGKVSRCRFVTWQKDGTIKGEDYGKVNGEISNQDFYDKAQLAVRAMDQYAAQFAEVQDLKRVDAVSGATNSYNQFIEAVEQALEKAKD
ncbi:MAG: FMN-binding protein [Treponema sp.]|jgi:major membrane immunogen (membrane-anchored lipoprotein)|nr:FMN-binding protein [Treponema sp.]